MNGKYILRTGLGLTLKKKFDKDYELPLFDLHGNEDEIYYKLNLQLCAVLAKMRSDTNPNIDYIEELNKLKDKFINNKCQCK